MRSTTGRRSSVCGLLDAHAVVASLDSPEVNEAYAADKAETRSAAGGATEFQGKAARDGDLVRYTAPSVIFEHDGHRSSGKSGFLPKPGMPPSRTNNSTTI